MPHLFYIQFELANDQKEGGIIGVVGSAKTDEGLMQEYSRYQHIVTKEYKCITATAWSWKVSTYAKLPQLKAFMAGAETMLTCDDCHWFVIEPDLTEMKKLMLPVKAAISQCNLTGVTEEIESDDEDLGDDEKSEF